MTYADLLPLYYPPVSYDVRATGQAAERQAEAAIFDGVQAQSAQLLAAAYAPTAGGDITRWERLLGINPPQPATTPAVWPTCWPNSMRPVA